MTSREQFCQEIARLKSAKKRTKSQHLKSDYGKAIRRMQNELRQYDIYQKEAQHA